MLDAGYDDRAVVQVCLGWLGVVEGSDLWYVALSICDVAVEEPCLLGDRHPVEVFIVGCREVGAEEVED